MSEINYMHYKALSVGGKNNTKEYRMMALPQDNFPAKDIKFVHEVTSNGWHDVKEHAAMLIADIFEFKDVIAAHHLGVKARIAIEARFEDHHNGITYPNYVYEVENAALKCYESLHELPPKGPEEPNYKHDILVAKQTRLNLACARTNAEQNVAERKRQRPTHQCIDKNAKRVSVADSDDEDDEDDFTIAHISRLKRAARAS